MTPLTRAGRFVNVYSPSCCFTLRILSCASLWADSSELLTADAAASTALPGAALTSSMASRRTIWAFKIPSSTQEEKSPPRSPCADGASAGGGASGGGGGSELGGSEFGGTEAAGASRLGSENPPKRPEAGGEGGRGGGGGAGGGAENAAEKRGILTLGNGAAAALACGELAARAARRARRSLAREAACLRNLTPAWRFLSRASFAAAASARASALKGFFNPGDALVGFDSVLDDGFARAGFLAVLLVAVVFRLAVADGGDLAAGLALAFERLPISIRGWSEHRGTRSCERRKVTAAASIG